MESHQAHKFEGDYHELEKKNGKGTFLVELLLLLRGWQASLSGRSCKFQTKYA